VSSSSPKRATPAILQPPVYKLSKPSSAPKTPPQAPPGANITTQEAQLLLCSALCAICQCCDQDSGVPSCSCKRARHHATEDQLLEFNAPLTSHCSLRLEHSSRRTRTLYISSPSCLRQGIDWASLGQGRADAGSCGAGIRAWFTEASRAGWGRCQPAAGPQSSKLQVRTESLAALCGLTCTTACSAWTLVACSQIEPSHSIGTVDCDRLWVLLAMGGLPARHRCVLAHHCSCTTALLTSHAASGSK